MVSPGQPRTPAVRHPCPQAEPTARGRVRAGPSNRPVVELAPAFQTATMTRLAVVLVLACALIPTAEAARLVYRTPDAAGNYLEHRLERWAGVHLRSQDPK